MPRKKDEEQEDLLEEDSEEEDGDDEEDDDDEEEGEAEESGEWEEVDEDEEEDGDYEYEYEEDDDEDEDDEEDEGDEDDDEVEDEDDDDEVDVRSGREKVDHKAVFPRNRQDPRFHPRPKFLPGMARARSAYDFGRGEALKTDHETDESGMDWDEMERAIRAGEYKPTRQDSWSAQMLYKMLKQRKAL